MLGKMFKEYKEYGTLIIRIGLGIVFFYHGAQKCFGMFGGYGLSATIDGFRSMDFPLPAVMGTLASVGELLGGTLVMAGIITRYAAGNLAIIMLVAIFAVHGKNGFALPHGYEYCFALLLMSLSLVVSGGGKASVDNMLGIDDKV